MTTMTPEQQKRFDDVADKASDLADEIEMIASEVFETTANEMDEEFANMSERRQDSKKGQRLEIEMSELGEYAEELNNAAATLRRLREIAEVKEKAVPCHGG